MNSVAASIFLALLVVSAQGARDSNYENSNCVVFRLDDVQDWFLGSVQRTIMDTLRANNTPMTIGIIAHYFNIGDPLQIAYVKNASQDEDWNFEIANHGWNHEYFSTFTYDQQVELLREGLNKTLDDLSCCIDEIPTFIAPFNDFNNNTLLALKEVGFKYFSSMIQLDFPPYPHRNTSLYHWPIGAATANLADETSFIGVPWNETWNQIVAQMDQSGFSVIMLHPQEFGSYNATGFLYDEVNQTMLAQLKILINKVADAGYDFCTLGDLADAFAQIQPATSGTTRALTTHRLTTQPLTTQSISTKAVTSGAVTSAHITTASITSAAITSGTSSKTGVTTASLSTTSRARVDTTAAVSPPATQLVDEFTMTLQCRGDFNQSVFVTQVLAAAGVNTSRTNVIVVVSVVEVTILKRSDVTSWIVVFYLNASANSLDSTTLVNNLNNYMKNNNQTIGNFTVLSSSVSAVSVSLSTTGSTTGSKILSTTSQLGSKATTSKLSATSGHHVTGTTEAHETAQIVNSGYALSTSVFTALLFSLL